MKTAKNFKFLFASLLFFGAVLLMLVKVAYATALVGDFGGASSGFGMSEMPDSDLSQPDAVDPNFDDRGGSGGGGSNIGGGGVSNGKGSGPDDGVEDAFPEDRDVTALPIGGGSLAGSSGALLPIAKGNEELSEADDVTKDIQSSSELSEQKSEQKAESTLDEAAVSAVKEPVDKAEDNVGIMESTISQQDDSPPLDKSGGQKSASFVGQVLENARKAFKRFFRWL